MWLNKHYIFLLVAGFGIFGYSETYADPKVKRLGGYGDWYAEVYVEKKNKRICHIWSRPIKKKGKYRKRGDVAFYVTHRPPKIKNEVSILAGYKYKKDSKARALIGGAKFVFFTDEDVAWLRTVKKEKALVQAMQRGRTMTFEGVSSRSTKTTDIYSLTGFSAAYNEISKACRIK